MEIVEFLTACLDEDERIARAAAGLQADPENGWGVSDRAITPHIAIVHEDEARAHIATWNPTRVLREIEAKRAVVARYEFACREASRLDLAEDEREMWIRVGGALQSVVIQLAAPYAGRPGFKAEEWAP
ncbi:DUF6221 family protein [Streptomyces sp. NPDC059441]|uniref:DUF6221 family protein n=1 Tax=Streptomyces sp. NPDC059441 TaxID=3346829 RepID=UPI00367E228C